MKSNNVFVDILLCYVLVILAILALVKIQTTEIKKSSEQNAIFQVVIEWDGKSHSDVDLWVIDSNKNIVGFNRREGAKGSLMALARDDLGSRNDKDSEGKIIEVNKEIVNIRGTETGEYIANVHLYAKGKEFVPPLEVKATLVKVKPFREIVSRTVTLSADGDEETLFRFTFSEEGKVINTNEFPSKFVTQSIMEGY